MSFFNILKGCNFDFEAAKLIFYKLTDLQIAWFNSAAEKDANEKDRQMQSNSKSNFGESKSFNLRGD